MTQEREAERAARLDAAFAKARDWDRTATPAQRKAMREAQRESWVRAMTTPCEHGVLDFEQCGECRAPQMEERL